MIYPVYIPQNVDKPVCRNIAFGSAIVGKPHADYGRITVYFEGNLFGAENMRSLEARAMIAAGRLHDSYPTIAKMSLPENALLKIGNYHYDSHTLEVDKQKMKDVLDWLALDASQPTIFTQ